MRIPRRDKNVDSWMYELDPSVRQIALAIREIIFDTLPDVRESIKWSQPVFRTDRDLFYINGTEKYATLGFFVASSLSDPDGKLGGTGKRVRHLRVRAPEDIDRDQIVAWLREADGVDSSPTV